MEEDCIQNYFMSVKDKSVVILKSFINTFFIRLYITRGFYPNIKIYNVGKQSKGNSLNSFSTPDQRKIPL